MAKFEVEITETLERRSIVEAGTLDEALSLVKRKYDKQEIVLDSADFVEMFLGGAELKEEVVCQK